MIHTLHTDRLVRVRERSEQTIVPNAELELIRANQPSEVVVRIPSRPLESFDHTTSHPAVELL